MADISQADLDRAQAAMEKAKKPDERQRLAAVFADLRRAWRLQEEDAGRRVASTGEGA